MKLYHWLGAPNPRRVRIFIAEKGLTIPMEDVGHAFRLRDDYVRRYAAAMVPMLELDDGTQIGEAMAICRYLEKMYPTPTLMGGSGREEALIDMWERRAYELGFTGVAEVFRNTHPQFKDRSLPVYGEALPQIPALVERGHWRLRRFLELVDAQLAHNQFVAGSCYSVADITAICTVGFADLAGLTISPDFENFHRWYREVRQRASTAA